MKERILMICKEISCEDILEDTQLITSGLFDSYMVMELIDSLEKEYEIKFYSEEIMNLDNFSCVNCIFKIVSKKKEELEQEKI